MVKIIDQLLDILPGNLVLKLELMLQVKDYFF